MRGKPEAFIRKTRFLCLLEAAFPLRKLRAAEDGSRRRASRTRRAGGDDGNSAGCECKICLHLLTPFVEIETLKSKIWLRSERERQQYSRRFVGLSSDFRPLQKKAGLFFCKQALQIQPVGDHGQIAVG